MIERKTVHKWCWVWDFEEEEQWLNDMAMDGWALDSVGFATYRFIRCQPGEYTVRLEMHGIDDRYLGFMHDLGAEYVGRVFQWIFFRRKSELGAFDIFSDIDSRITHLAHIAKFIRVVGIANIAIGIANTFNPSHIGFLNLLCACLLMYALGRIRGKEESLKKERALREG